MLAIRMQRVGRKGHAQFRIIVQDSRFSPKSGRVVAYLGSYDPHSKVLTLDKDKTSAYLSQGAQPSDRVAKLLQKEGLKLPDWVKIDQPKKREIRHPEKLRRNRPAEPKEAKAETAPAEAEAESTAEGTPTEESSAESPAETTVVEESAAESSAEAESAEESAEEVAGEAESPSPQSAEEKSPETETAAPKEDKNDSSKAS